jgi:hypothetical protein
MWKLWLGAGVGLALLGCDKNNNETEDTNVGTDDTDTTDTHDTHDTEDTDTEDTQDTAGDTDTHDTHDTHETGESGGPDTHDSGRHDTFDSGRGGTGTLAMYWSGGGTLSSSNDFAGSETFNVFDYNTGADVCVYTWSSVTGVDASGTSSPISVECADSSGNSCDFAFAVNRGSGKPASGCRSGLPAVATSITGWGYTSSYSYMGYDYGSALMAYYSTTGVWFPAAFPDYGYGSATRSGTKFTYETRLYSFYY